MKVAGFTISKIVIIESLEQGEVKTGRALHEYIQAQILEINFPILLEYRTCANYVEFVEILRQLAVEARVNNEFPVVHVECHGSQDEGLEFENGSTVSWDELAQELLLLNVACKFNLLAVFSACFGGHFLGQLGPIKAAPCWCVVAPTEAVYPDEIMAGFRIFYSTLLQYADAGKAATAIAKLPLSKGRWFGQPAELWFETVVTNYITQQCTKEATRERVKKLRRKLIREGHPPKGIGALTRMMCKMNRENLKGKYFDRYFQVKAIPDNMQRFEHARDRLERKLKEFRDSGKYCL